MCGATEGGLSLDGIDVKKAAIIQGQVVRSNSHGQSDPVGKAGLVAERHRDTDQRAVLGPGAVVVLHVRLVEQLVQGEPGVAGPLADPQYAMVSFAGSSPASV